jgi:hypothetical protein
MPPLRSPLRALLATLPLALAAAASGQVERVNPEIVAAESLQPTERTALKAWTDRQLQRLRSDDPDEMEDARRSLLSPFDGRAAPSIAFRLEYARAVSNDLRRLVVDENVGRAIAATLIAGKCAAPEMINPLGSALGDPRASVRGAAAAGLKDVVRQAAAGDLQGNAGADAVDLLLEATGSETDLNAASLQMVALAEARGSDLHRRAAEGLAASIPELIGGLAPEPGSDPQLVGRTAATIGRGMETIFLLLIDPARDAGQDPDFLRSVSATAGHALPFGVRLLDNPEPAAHYDTQGGWRIRAMMAQSEQIVLLAEARLLDQAPREARVAEAFDNALRMDDSRRVAALVNELVDLASDLSGTPRDAFDDPTR